MVKKEPLMRNKIKRFKSKEKKFNQFGDYLVMYATLFGFFTNFLKEYIVGPKKAEFMLGVAMILETMYILAISLKITSHYSVKKYINDYKREVNIQENYVKKQVELDLEVPSEHLKVPHSSDFNKLINRSLVFKRFKRSIIFAIVVLVSAILLILVNNINLSRFTTIAIIIVYMGWVFPILFILFTNSLLQFILFSDK